MNIIVANNEPWVADAVCASADPEEWFPEKGANSRKAKNICRTCPVIDECLQFALDNNEKGIWGGTSTRERATLRRLQSREVA